MTIKAVDLFCGVGGLTYGLQKAGIPVVAGIDIDDSCEYAYTHNNNCTFIHKSVEDVTGKEIRALLRGADVKILVGCAPCQPFSSHQKDKQNRSKHKDWKLLYQFGRLVEETRPHIVSMENVPELEKEKVFKDFVSTLEGLNYIVNYQVVNVANYGVPQRRKRLILLASRRKEIKLIDATHQKHLTVRDAIGSLPRISAGEANENDRLHISPALSPINLERIQHSVPGGTWRDWPERLVLNCHKKEGGKTYASVYGRMKWDDLSPTITTQFIGYGTGRFGHPEVEAILSDEINTNSPDMGIKSIIDSQKKKLLISQTYRDKDLADIIYNMLVFNNVPPEDIIYTNCDDEVSRIPEGDVGKSGIYDYLRDFFVDSYSTQKIYVIFVTSHNTKSSWGALMEVGAAWITQVEHKIFNIYDFRPEHPLDDEQQWHSSSRDDDGNLYMSKLSVDIFAQKIEYICDKLGYKKRTRQENKDHLSTLVKVTPR